MAQSMGSRWRSTLSNLRLRATRTNSSFDTLHQTFVLPSIANREHQRLALPATEEANEDHRNENVTTMARIDGALGRVRSPLDHDAAVGGVESIVVGFGESELRWKGCHSVVRVHVNHS